MIGVLGAGAFGTALAIALARDGRSVTLWARDPRGLSKGEGGRLPGIVLPKNVSVTSEIGQLAGSQAVLLCLPMQVLGGFLARHGADFYNIPLVACCKGIDLSTGQGAAALITASCPHTRPAVLTGPSFAADIARGLPTALTLACTDDAVGAMLQDLLSTATLRLYRTTDVTGAELGGALKNVIAIASGVVIGAGLGESARAAVVTRGYAEMLRLALALGARAETLAGLSGLGDLVLTCTSAQSRNFRFGLALGAGQPSETGVTVEGLPTATAIVALALRHGVDLPIASMVAALANGRVTLPEAIQSLLSRPLKQE